MPGCISKAIFTPWSGGETLHFAPVGDGDLIPLVIEHLQELRRPGTGDPVGGLVARRARRQAGERIDDRHAERLRQPDGLAQFLVGPRRHGRVGAERIVVDAQCAE
jgi:hypothetical protein